MQSNYGEIFLILAIFFLLLAMHPFIFYRFSLMLLFKKRALHPAKNGNGQKPSVAICMCAYNEAAVIVDKIESLLRIAKAYGNATIHVYTDGCQDATNALLQAYQNDISLHISPKRNGKTYGMNFLVENSSSELVMFTDANVEIPDDGLIKLAAPFADPECGCVTAQLKYINPKESATSFAGNLYWNIEESVKLLESETVGMVGVDGASFVVRREAYRPVPVNLIDDLFVTLSILIDGYRVVRAPGITVYERSAVNAGEEYRRKVRIACQAMNVHKALWPKIRKKDLALIYCYVSHRLIKWMMPYCLALSGLCLIGFMAAWIGVTPVLGLSVAGAMMLAIGAYVHIPLVSLISAIFISLFGVAQGVAMSLCSKQTFTTWEPASSVRG